MKIVLENYDDELTVVTSTGTSIDIRPVEIKKQLGVAGTTDQLEVTASIPIRVGKPFKTFDEEMIAHILIGVDHHDDFPGDPDDEDDEEEAEHEDP